MNILKELRNARRSISEMGMLYRQLNDIKYFQRRCYLEDKILHCTEPGITDRRYADCDIVVSLTSYGRRLQDVCFTIESIMQQTMKPNKIVLWIDPTCNNEPLPEALIRQQARGLVVVVVVEDIRSYKKLIPALKAYPEDAIITIDDDAIYEFDIVERLIKAFQQNPTMIHACRTHVMDFDASGNLKPYMQWKWCTGEAENPRHRFLTGVGGTLYPRHSLDDEVLNQEVFTSICRTADDVWFNAMALKKGTLINKVVTRSAYGEDYLMNDAVQDDSLGSINNAAVNQNDVQIKAVYGRYGLFKKLK